MKTFFLRKFTFPFLYFVLFQVPSAYAETTECTEITALPTTITSQGVFCLKRSIGLSPGLLTGAAIDIQTNNVIIDLNGFKIGNLSAGAGTEAWGIQAVDRKNIVIKNGTVRGFFGAVEFSGVNSSGHVIEDMLFDRNTEVGIFAAGTGSVIRRNQIVLIGGSTVEESDSAFGIIVNGSNMRILDNDILELFADEDGTVEAISVLSSSGTVVQGNRISNEQLPDLPAGLGGGISVFSGGVGGTNVRDNHIMNFPIGIDFFASAGIYSGNQVFGAVVPFLGGTDGGNNASVSITPMTQTESSFVDNSVNIRAKKLQKVIGLYQSHN